jgi:hypothetical protein
LTPDGYQFIERLKPGDWILAAPEDEPEHAAEPRQVGEIFVRVSPVLNVHVGGRVIRATPEHPFFVISRGWIPAASLEPGDLLQSHDGQCIPVEVVTDSREVTTVYNFRVDEYHTFYVGKPEWGFSIWVHNPGPTCAGTSATSAQRTREANLAKGIPESQLGPSGKLKILWFNTAHTGRRRRPLGGR